MPRSGKLIAFLASLVFANVAQAGVTATFGDWSTGTTEDGSAISAITLNLDGDALAEFCYLDKHCEWRFSIKNFSCTPGQKSVVLLNASTGTNSAMTECLG